MINISLNYKHPEVKKMYIPPKPNTRPNILRGITRGSVTHHTACEDVPAINFYHALLNSNIESSYHMVIDFDGTVFIFIPLDEIAYASGSFNYSKIGKQVFKSQAWKYTIDKECCVTKDWYINNRQQEVVAELDADICIEYGLDPGKDLYRHHDIALDKPECPWYYIKNDGINWERHLSMVKLFYNYKVSGKVPRLDLY